MAKGEKCATMDRMNIPRNLSLYRGSPCCSSITSALTREKDLNRHHTRNRFLSENQEYSLSISQSRLVLPRAGTVSPGKFNSNQQFPTHHSVISSPCSQCRMYSGPLVHRHFGSSNVDIQSFRAPITHKLTRDKYLRSLRSQVGKCLCKNLLPFYTFRNQHWFNNSGSHASLSAAFSLSPSSASKTSSRISSARPILRYFLLPV